MACVASVFMKEVMPYGETIRSVVGVDYVLCAIMQYYFIVEVAKNVVALMP
jgi:hypothetical protein